MRRAHCSRVFATRRSVDRERAAGVLIPLHQQPMLEARSGNAQRQATTSAEQLDATASGGRVRLGLARLGSGLDDPSRHLRRCLRGGHLRRSQTGGGAQGARRHGATQSSMATAADPGNLRKRRDKDKNRSPDFLCSCSRAAIRRSPGFVIHRSVHGADRQGGLDRRPGAIAGGERASMKADTPELGHSAQGRGDGRSHPRRPS